MNARRDNGFALAVPMASFLEPAERNAEACADGESHSQLRPPARILLAEDDPELRRLLSNKLRRDGHLVDEAKSGMDLFEMIEEMDRNNRSYDLIVTDIRMPGLTGLEVIDGLFADGVFDVWTTPVIFITAFGDGATRVAAARLKATLFDKPFDIEALRDCAANLVARRPAPEPQRSKASGVAGDPLNPVVAASSVDVDKDKDAR